MTFFWKIPTKSINLMQNIGPIIIFNFNRKVPEFTFLSMSLFTWLHWLQLQAVSSLLERRRLLRLLQPRQIEPFSPSLASAFGRAVHGAGKWHMPLLVSEAMTEDVSLLSRKKRAVWVSGICTYSTWLCWQDTSLIARFWRLSTSLIVIFWIVQLGLESHILGGAYYRVYNF